MNFVKEKRGWGRVKSNQEAPGKRKRKQKAGKKGGKKGRYQEEGGFEIGRNRVCASAIWMTGGKKKRRGGGGGIDKKKRNTSWPK